MLKYWTCCEGWHTAVSYKRRPFDSQNNPILGLFLHILAFSGTSSLSALCIILHSSTSLTSDVPQTPQGCGETSRPLVKVQSMVATGIRNEITRWPGTRAK